MARASMKRRIRPERGGRGQRRVAARGGTHPFLWGLLAGVALIVTAGYFLLPPPPPPGITPSDSSAGSAPSPTPALPGQPEAGGATQNASVPQYDFYTILRDMEVKVPDWQLEAERRVVEKPGDLIEPGEYVLQVGAFRRAEDAQRAKADLALRGIRAAIQEVTINGNERWFRVRIGPFAQVESLREARAQLIEQGVGFIVVRDRRG